MIIGIGVDLADPERLQRIFARFGAHFTRKILTPAEIEAMPANSSQWLAGRFAAKEAAVKALGTGFSGGVGPLCVETLNDKTGRPCLTLLGAARDRASQLGVRACHISISHEPTRAVAMVILED